MSLRTDYKGDIDTALALAKAAGVAIITDNLSTVTSEMQAAAAKGLTGFTVTLTVSFQPEDLRLEGNLWNAFTSGICEKLINEEIYNQEFTINLNTELQNETKVDLVFSF